jgi:putative mRNA 3-end processing factor
MAFQPEDAIFLVSFQVPGTGGSKLLETGMVTIKEKDEKVRAKVRHFDFSSHSGASYLKAFLKGLKGKPYVYVVHGEPDSCDYLAQWTQDELNMKATAPNEGDEFTV